MQPSNHHLLLNALANELEDIGVRVTHLARNGVQEQFDMQYRDLPEPPARGGKTPDLQGERWGLIHLGKADASAYRSGIASQLDTLVRYVVGDPSVSLHVAVPFERKHEMQNAMLRTGGHQTCHKMWVWPFREVGRTYIPEPKLRAR